MLSHVIAIPRELVSLGLFGDSREGRVKADVKTLLLIHIAYIFKPQRLSREYPKILTAYEPFSSFGYLPCQVDPLSASLGYCPSENKHSFVNRITSRP